MKYILYSIFILIILASCGTKKEMASSSSNKKTELLDNNTFKLEILSEDKTYGYTEKNPIKVGGVSNQEGPLNERRFLNALAGPNGENIKYTRLGSCCPFKTSRGFDGKGLLDKYEITYDGLKEPIILYINMYDSDVLQVPVGFKIKGLKLIATN